MDKRMEVRSTAKIYLATPWFNPEQKERVGKASSLLSCNPTVAVVHFPFDYQYKDATIDNQDGVFGSLEWQVATYQNDLSAMGTSDCGVFLYDLDNLDDGTAFEIGYMRSMGKPAIVVTFSHKEDVYHRVKRLCACSRLRQSAKLPHLIGYMVARESSTKVVL